MANEKRLIYPKDFLDLFYVASAGQDKAFVKAVEMVLEDTPTVDAVEVVHGRWVGHYDGSWIHKRKWLTGYDCSVCGNFINTMTPYCPNCGAKMDGGNEDD